MDARLYHYQYAMEAAETELARVLAVRGQSMLTMSTLPTSGYMPASIIRSDLREIEDAVRAVEIARAAFAAAKWVTETAQGTESDSDPGV